MRIVLLHQLFLSPSLKIPSQGKIMAHKTKKVIDQNDMSAGAGKIKSLIDAGADVNTRFEGSVTPLMAAAVRGNLGMVDVLLKAGAAIDLQQDNQGMTALMKASMWGHTRVASKLVIAGAKVNFKTQYGWTALMYAVLSGKEEMIKLLLEADADPKIKDNGGKTALDYAQDKGYLQIVALLTD